MANLRPGPPRPAFYALSAGGWRDYVTLLHLPYTAWHLSYVVMGAALAPLVRVDRLFLSVLAFFLAMGVAAHSLDELNGRPLQTRVPKPVLVAAAALGLTGAVAVGTYGVLTVHWSIGLFIMAGAFLVVAYNLELWEGRFHNDWWFAAAWGVFPVATAYWAMALNVSLTALLLCAYAFAMSLAQRKLSTPVRLLRRKSRRVAGAAELNDGTTLVLNAHVLTAVPERALFALAAANIALGLALLARHLAH
jgi:hypothetical protein